MCLWGVLFSFYHLSPPDDPSQHWSERFPKPYPPLIYPPGGVPQPDLSPPTRFKLRGFVAITRNVQGDLRKLMPETSDLFAQPQGGRLPFRFPDFDDDEDEEGYVSTTGSKKRKRKPTKPKQEKVTLFKVVNHKSIVTEFIVAQFHKIKFKRYKSKKNPGQFFPRRHVEQYVTFQGRPNLTKSGVRFEHAYEWRACLVKSLSWVPPKVKSKARRKPKTKARRLRYHITVKVKGMEKV